MTEGLRRAALAAALLATLALPAAASAGGRGHPPGGLVAVYAERLGLDAQRRETVRAIVERSGQRDSVLREELHAAKRKLRALLSQEGAPDPQAVLAQADTIGALEVALHKNRLAAILEIRAQLSPEQRTELTRIREEKRARRHGHCRRRHADCDPDLLEHCPGVPPGAASLRCLQEHWDGLSERCRSAFDPTPRHVDLDRP